jgi:hypothetical protein
MGFNAVKIDEFAICVPVVAKYRRKFQADFGTLNRKLSYLNVIMLLNWG